MSCNKYDDKLSFYVQNELSEAEQNDINEHIKTCCSCNMKVEELGTLMDKISDFEEVELPEDFHESLLSRAEKELWTENKFKPPYSRLAKYASAAAVFALCIFSVTHLNIFGGAKKDSAVADKGLVSSAASSTKNNEYGSQEVVSGILNDTSKGSGMADASSSQAAKEKQKAELKDTNGQNQATQDSYRNSTPVTENSAPPSSGSADITDSKSNTVNYDVNASIIAPQASKDNQLDTEKSMLASSQLLQLRVESQNVQIKTNNIEAAFTIIDEQAMKVNAKATHIALTAGQTTQESTYSSTRSFAAPRKAQTEDTVTVEVKKEYELKFKSLLAEVFGEKNIQFEATGNTSADTVTFIIKISL